MSFWNFIRDIFTGRNSEEPKNRGFSDYQDDYDRYNFRNPIWQNDEDDDIDDFRRSRGNMQFHIFSDPLEITKYFESQIDDILKNFVFGFNNDGHNTFTNVPPFSSLQDENLRDKMLKSNKSDFNETKAKVDTDLDGKVTADNFSNVWEEYSKPKSLEVFVPQQRIIGKSIRKEYVRRSDGTVEQKQIFRDSEGNEKVTVSQQIGDKIHTVTTKRDKNGLETKTEEFVNIDESNYHNMDMIQQNQRNPRRQPPPMGVSDLECSNVCTDPMCASELKFPEMRGGILYTRCYCVHRDGLQDDCPLTHCQGQPDCLVKPWPVCPPARYLRLRHPQQYPAE